MKNYNLVLQNPEQYTLTTIEKNYVSLYLPKDHEFNNKRNSHEQEEFRKNCVNYYKKCIISGTFAGECEACHIIPHGIGLNVIENSLLLTRSLHHLFDNGYWTINSITGTILISEQILNEDTSIHKYLNINLKHLLNETLSDNLLWHYNNIFKI